jgi:hypothetical protein
MVTTRQIAEEFGFGTKLEGHEFKPFTIVIPSRLQVARNLLFRVFAILLTKGLRATSASTRLSPLDAIHATEFFGIAEAMPFQSW